MIDYNLIAIDPGTIKTGVYINEKGEERVICFKPDGKTYLERSYLVALEIEKILSDMNGKTIVVIEALAFSKSFTSGFSKMAELHGMIKAKCLFWRVDGIELISPRTWKSGTISANLKKSNKKQVEKYIELACDLYGHEFKTDDMVDAYLMGQHYIKTNKQNLLFEE